MGIFDWLKESDEAAARPEPHVTRRFPLDRGAMFDLGKTALLERLLAADGDRGDPVWVDAFHDACWTASVELPAEPLFIGPDGLPYLRLDVPREGTFDSQCLANLAGGCLEQLTGAVFFASPDAPPDEPGFVLSLGLIDSLVRYDSPDGDPQDARESAGHDGRGRTIVIDEDQEVLIGAPSADYLSKPQARGLYRHLADGWGIEDPRVALMVNPSMRPTRSLVIGHKRSDFEDEATIDEMCASLMWNLNPNRAIVLLPEEWSVDDLFPLGELC